LFIIKNKKHMGIDTLRGGNDIEIGKPFSLFHRSAVRTAVDTITFIDEQDPKEVKLKVLEDDSKQAMHIIQVEGEMGQGNKRYLKYVAGVFDSPGGKLTKTVDMYADESGCYYIAEEKKAGLLKLDGGKLKEASNKDGPKDPKEKEIYNIRVQNARDLVQQLRTEREKTLKEQEDNNSRLPNVIRRAAGWVKHSVKRLLHL
jgi:hypothetical protein